MNFVAKGENPFTEHNSAIRSGVPDPADSSTPTNSSLVAALKLAGPNRRRGRGGKPPRRQHAVRSRRGIRAGGGRKNHALDGRNQPGSRLRSLAGNHDLKADSEGDENGNDERLLRAFGVLAEPGGE